MTRLVVVVSILMMAFSIPVESAKRGRRVSPPTQGFYANSFGDSFVELHGLRVPLVIKGDAHERILILANYWASVMDKSLRVVSAMDHRHARRSAHYKGLAIDFQGDKIALDGLAKWFRDWHYKVLWRTRGHWRHVHVEELVQKEGS